MEMFQYLLPLYTEISVSVLRKYSEHSCLRPAPSADTSLASFRPIQVERQSNSMRKPHNQPVKWDLERKIKTAFHLALEI